MYLAFIKKTSPTFEKKYEKGEVREREIFFFFLSNFWIRSRKHVFAKTNWCRICLCGYFEIPVISLLLFIKDSEHDQRTTPIKSNSSQLPHLWDESHTVNNEEWIAEVNSSQSICLAWCGKCNQTRCSIIKLDARSLSRNKECRLQLHSERLHLGKHGRIWGNAGNQQEH